jgi:hypothetical protein
MTICDFGLRARTIVGEVHDPMRLADLPIDVAEAMYSPDFVELATIGPGGLPLALPMSFTLDVADNAVRFSSPLTAGRLGNLTHDPRCCISFTRVTSGYPSVVLQGIATAGEVMEGVRRGPSRRFTVTPARLLFLDDPPHLWQLPDLPQPPTATTQAAGRRTSATPITVGDLDALVRFETTVIALLDADGWPLTLPVEPWREAGAIEATLPGSNLLRLVSGPASLLGHTWTRDGPRYLALTGRAAIDGSALRFLPNRALSRP